MTMDNVFEYFAPSKTDSKTDTSNEKYKEASENKIFGYFAPSITQGKRKI